MTAKYIITLVDKDREFTKEDEPIETICSVADDSGLDYQVDTLEEAVELKEKLEFAFPGEIYKIYMEIE